MNAQLAAPACPGFRHLEEVWGTVVTVDVRDVDGSLPAPEAVEAALAEAGAFMARVDRVFSTYRPDSLVSAYRAGDLPVIPVSGFGSFSDDDVAWFRHILALCEQGREVTEGAFDPWAVDGGFDPSGVVKGWAAEAVADLLVERGLRNVCVNAAGDLTVRGLADVGTPWVVGVPHPEDRHSIVHSFPLDGGSAATSGLSEKGEHIVLPGGRWPGYGARQATVSGPDAAWCEILSTGLMVAGRYGLDWFAQLPGYQAFCVDATEDRVFRLG
ncbi:FAD:protein FMN transferase [Kocuria sp.]|uniref:FAD:protein FMN transferase n=1 Tax=Kocuria sp. TaxID=1871328 RepID=UPI0026DFF450|nr:FAD:protein FMN transferase [Kocuria sp.]MDO5619433.1 FAD:protein FMN transferase [Kocuria sp.]